MSGHALEELYERSTGIAWACKPDDAGEVYGNLLTWLGVDECPRVLKASDDGVDRSGHRQRVEQSLPIHSQPVRIPQPRILDRINVSNLSKKASAALLSVLARQWDKRYRRASRESVGYQYYSQRTHEFDSHWWHEVKTEFRPPQMSIGSDPVPLSQCWLPDPKTGKGIRDVLPAIDLSAFTEDEQGTVKQWLIDVVGLRQHLSEVTPDEWRTILRDRIPELVPEPEAGG